MVWRGQTLPQTKKNPVIMIQQVTSGYAPKELKAGTQTGIHTPLFVTAFSTTAKRWKQPKCPWTDGEISQMWSIDKMEYYSALKGRKF